MKAVASSLLFFIPALSLGQVLPFQHYTLRDGLPSNHITALRQDSRGYLWIGTDNGLSRYDGTEFKNYTTADGLSNLYITEIVESSIHPGTTWIGTIAGGLVKMAGRSFSAVHIGDDNIGNLCEGADGSLWCTTGSGNYTIRSDSVCRLSDTDTRGSLIQSLRGDRIAIISADTLEERRSDGSILLSRRLPLVAGEYVLAATLDREGILWTFTSEGALLAISDSSTTRHQLKTTLAPSAFNPPRIIDDGRGHLWISTPRGVLVVRTADFSVRNIVDFGEPDAELSGPVLMDHEGTIWFATRASGILKLTEQHILHIPLDPIDEGSYNLVACSDSNGHIWIKTLTGLCEVARTNRGSWKVYRHPYPAGITGGSDAGLFIDPAGRLSIGPSTTAPFSLFEIVGQTNSPSRLKPVMSLPGRAFAPEGLGLTFTIDRSLRGWFSLAPTGAAVVDLHSGKLIHTYTMSNGLPAAGLRALLVDRGGNAWCGGWNEGLAVAKAGSDTFHAVAEYHALQGAGVRSLYEDREGTIWIGTRYAGLVRNRGGAYCGASLTDGLLSNAIWSIAETDRRIWCGTDVGLEVVDKETCRPLPPIPELIGQRVYACGACRNDFVWSVRARDLVLCEQPELAAHTPPPPVYITSCSVSGIAVPPDGPHEFNPDQTSCTIGFVGISFRGAVRYQYRMSGADSTWTLPGREHTVTYASLSPGTYEFSVRAINGDGTTSTAPATFAFVIAAPVWQRWWFILGVAALAGSTLYGLFQYRLYHLMNLERMRLRIASDLHDDVGTNLSHIVIAAQIMERETSLPEGARSRARDIDGVATATHEMLRDIVWMLNPSNDSMEDFLLKMKETASRLLPGITWRFIAPDDRLPDSVSIEFKRHVFLVFKESLNNMAKHSSASEATIEVHYDPKEFRLTISDNGTGFDPARARAGNGLASLSSRAKAIGGTLEVRSRPGEGTTVTLSVKNHANA